MSWTRAHVERFSKLQGQVQGLVSEIGTDALGADTLITINELMTAVQGIGLGVVEAEEHSAESKAYVEGLRQFVAERNHA